MAELGKRTIGAFSGEKWLRLVEKRLRWYAVAASTIIVFITLFEFRVTGKLAFVPWPAIAVSEVSVWLFLYYTIGLIKFWQPLNADTRDLRRVRQAAAKTGTSGVLELRAFIRSGSPLARWIEGLYNSRDLETTDLQAIGVVALNDQPRPTQVGNFFLLLSLLATVLGLFDVIGSLSIVLHGNADLSVTQRALFDSLPRMGSAFLGTAVGIVLSIVYSAMAAAISRLQDSVNTAVEQFAVLELAPLVLPKAPSRILDTLEKTIETVRSVQESNAESLKTVRNIQGRNLQMVSATLRHNLKMIRKVQNRNMQLAKAGNRQNLKTVRHVQEYTAGIVTATEKAFDKLAALTKSAADKTERQVSAAINKNAELLAKADNAMQLSAKRLDEAMANTGGYLNKSSAALGSTAIEMQNLIAQNLSPGIHTLRSTLNAIQTTLGDISKTLGVIASSASGIADAEIRISAAEAKLKGRVEIAADAINRAATQLEAAGKVAASGIVEAEKRISAEEAKFEQCVEIAANAINRAASQLETASRAVAAAADKAIASFPDAKLISDQSDALRSVARQLSGLPDPAEWAKLLDKLNDSADKPGRAASA